MDTGDTVVNKTNQATVVTDQSTLWRGIDKLLTQFYKSMEEYTCEKY